MLTDLHRHLGGCLPLEWYGEESRPVAGLDDFLSLFDVSEWWQADRSIMSTVAEQAVLDAAAEGLDYVEFRINPLRRGDSDATLSAVKDGMRRAGRPHVARHLVLTATRDPRNPEELVDVAELAVRHGAVAIDVAGGHEGVELDDGWMRVAAAAVEWARSRNLRVTWHCGETPLHGHAAMRRVLEVIRPDRVGHGIQAVRDGGLPYGSLLKETGAVLELCPSVNVMTGVVGSWDEWIDKFRVLYAAGLPFSICTDNPGFAGVTVLDEMTAIHRRWPCQLAQDVSRLFGATGEPILL